MNQDATLQQQVARLKEFSQKMLTKLLDPGQDLQLNASVYAEQFGKFFGAANPQSRTRFAYHLQNQIQKFLQIFALKRLKKLVRQIPEPFHFIEQICDIWQNFERFVYALKFFSSAADNTYRTFYKFTGKFDSFLVKQQQSDQGDKRYKNQVSPVPVMASNQLRQFLKTQGIFDTLIDNFSKIFCTFLKQEREGLNTPRDKINQSLEFVEALHLDYECDCVRKADRYRIVKALSQTAPINRRSTANAFFEKYFTQKIFEDSQKYYKNWVDAKAINMSSSDELKQIIKFLDQQQSRAKFYIHDSKNERGYLDIVEKNLIEYRMQERLQKPTGLQSFLANYELDKVQIMDEITNFWKVYKRIYFKVSKSKRIILGIYENYLIQQLKVIANVVDKSADFIEQSIKLNKKNVQIISKILDSLHDFDRIRYERLQDSLSMKYVNEARQKNKQKQPMTASKHWAIYLHNKIKMKYGKNQKYNENVDGDIVNLFKLLVYKTIAVNQHCKYLCQRLLEQIDFSMEAQYANALSIETKVIEEMKKGSSENEVKMIQSCVKDVQNSFDLRLKLKESKNLAAFPFFNQIIRKSGKHWAETPVYDIKTPNALLKCRDVLKQQMQNQKQLFQYFNGASLFQASIKGQTHRFNLKNIYMMILLHIDESPGKKMFFPDIKKAIKPFGSSEVRALIELIKYLLELTCFGIIKCNKPLTPELIDPQKYSASDYFQINMNFKPAKPLPIYRTINIILSLQENLKKSINDKVASASNDEKNYEKDRRVAVELCTVKVLKHSQTLDGGKGTITFDEILKQQHRQHDVDAKYLKEVIQSLINRDVCARVDGKKNTYRYVS